MQRVALMLAVLLTSSYAGTAGAQDASDVAAYRALTQTPPGALTNPLGASITGSESGSWDLHARYGLMSLDDDEYMHNFGVGGDLRLGAGRLGATVGRYGPDCTTGDCPSHFMAAVTFGERLIAVALGRPSSSASFTVGLDVAAAIGTPPGATLFSTSVSLPFALVTEGRMVRLVPYIAPGFGTGLVEQDGGDTEAGLRAVFGAGVGALGLASGLTLNAAIHRVFLRDGNWLVGVGIGYTGGR